MLLTGASSPFFIPVILRFCLSVVSQIPWIFCARSFSDLTLCLINVFTSSMSKILFSLSCILLLKIASEIRVWVLKKYLILWFFLSLGSFLVLFPLSGLDQFYTYPCSVCVCIEFLNGSIYFLLMDIYCRMNKEIQRQIWGRGLTYSGFLIFRFFFFYSCYTLSYQLMLF